MDNILGEIKLWASNEPPMNYIFCDGRLLDIESNNSLFNILGYTYGGNSTEFAIPKMTYSDNIKYIICINGY